MQVLLGVLIQDQYREVEPRALDVVFTGGGPKVKMPLVSIVTPMREQDPGPSLEDIDGCEEETMHNVRKIFEERRKRLLAEAT